MLHGEDNDINIGQYGLGEERTLEDFERISGINFADRVLSPEAKEGVFTLDV